MWFSEATWFPALPTTSVQFLRVFLRCPILCGSCFYITVIRKKMKQKKDGQRVMQTLLWKQHVVLARRGKKQKPRDVDEQGAALAF